MRTTARRSRASPGVPGHVRQRLRDDVVRGDLHCRREPVVEGARDVDRHRRPGGERRHGRREAVFRQHRWMDAAGELTQLLGRAVQLGDRVVRHRGRRGRVIGQPRPHRPKRERDRHQALLGAVMQVTPDLASRLVLRGDDPRALRPQLPALGDVEDDAVEAWDAIGSDHLLATLEHPRRRPVRAHDAVFEPEGSVGGRRCPDPPVHVLAIVGMDDASERAPRAVDEVGRRIAGDPLDLVADHRHRPVGVERAAVDGAGYVRDDGGQLAVALVRLHAARSTESPNRRILHRLVIAHARAPPVARDRVRITPPPGHQAPPLRPSGAWRTL